MFNEIDVNGDGKLQKTEVRDYTKRMKEKSGGEFNEESFIEYFKNIDANEDGTVSKKELLDWVTKAMKQWYPVLKQFIDLSYRNLDIAQQFWTRNLQIESEKATGMEQIK